MSEQVKISIITVCYNSESTIARCMSSVSNQRYENYEHIIIDGNSQDATLHLVNKYKTSNSIVLSEEDDGIYDAMNKAIAMCSGDLIGILNSDDFYAKSTVLNDVSEIYKLTNEDIIAGAVCFVDERNRCQRVVKPNSFRPWMLFFGWMLPHTSTFISSEIYRKFGCYDMHLSTAADYELFVRLLLKNELSYYACNDHWVSMQMGGVTTSGMSSYLRTTRQMKNAIRKNGYFSSNLLLLLRLPIKYLTETLWQKK